VRLSRRCQTKGLRSLPMSIFAKAVPGRTQKLLRRRNLKSLKRQSAIHYKHLASDVGRLLRGKKQNRGRNVRRSS
jgi:hypothetical protein